MQEHKENPPTNKLGGGFTEDNILNAISKSGYPLQTVIKNIINRTFSLTPRLYSSIFEEWSYIHRDTGEVRTIDLIAEKFFWEITPDQPKVRPQLSLLIECKQSSNPFVFFLTSEKLWSPQFPLICGLRNERIKVSSNDSTSTTTFNVTHALGLEDHPFIASSPRYCASFAKCEHKSKQTTELTGEFIFRDLVLPIIRSMQHYQAIKTPTKERFYLDCILTLGIGIIDGPMIGVDITEEGPTLTLTPWVRIIRHEAEETNKNDGRIFAIDIVHKDYFEQYLNNHVLPFGEKLAKLVIKHKEEIYSGKAFASDMEKYFTHNIEERLQPSKQIIRRTLRKKT